MTPPKKACRCHKPKFIWTEIFWRTKDALTLSYTSRNFSFWIYWEGEEERWMYIHKNLFSPLWNSIKKKKTPPPPNPPTVNQEHLCLTSSWESVVDYSIWHCLSLGLVVEKANLKSYGNQYRTRSYPHTHLVSVASKICCRKAIFLNHRLVQTPFREGMSWTRLHQPWSFPSSSKRNYHWDSLSFPFSLSLLEAGQAWLCIVLVDCSSNSPHSEIFLISPNRGFSCNAPLF